MPQQDKMVVFTVKAKNELGRIQVFGVYAKDPDHACARFSMVMKSWRMVGFLKSNKK